MKKFFMNLAFILIILLVILVSYVALHLSEKEDSLNGAPIAEVIVPKLTAEGDAGQQIFDIRCASCHGVNAAGRDGIGPPLVHVMYVPDQLTDESFAAAVKKGAPSRRWTFGDMPPVTDLSDEDIKNLIVYTRELQKANGVY